MWASRDLGGRRRRTGEGAVAVEFALVLPVLLLLVFGIIGYGLVLAQQAAISNAVRSGARFGSVNLYNGDHTCEEVITKARGAARTIGLSDTTQVGIKVVRRSEVGPDQVICAAAAGVEAPAVTERPCAGSPPAEPDTLYVEGRYTTDIGLPVPGLDGTVLTATGAFQCEYSG
ncbi:MAG: TadE/TadG family type IV pilus assembly protein [Actinomycetota bacterium]